MRKIVVNAIKKLHALEGLTLETDEMYEEKFNEQTDPTYTPFSAAGIEIQKFLASLEAMLVGWDIDDDDRPLSTENRDTISHLMVRSNAIWETRRRIKSGDLELSSLSNIDLDMKLIEYIRDGQKINAIKYYRKKMNENHRKEVGLKEAKEYVDALQIRYQRQIDD